MLEELLDALFAIAVADGRVTEPEIAFLTKVADRFGLPAGAFARVAAQHGVATVHDPYGVIGVARTRWGPNSFKSGGSASVDM